uniref:DNA replication complex GINS protein PSF3 n=1 Tax=Panagrolaimus sp. PS1159 TaxID=55785 RepID=A0AC35G4G7_9BILA
MSKYSDYIALVDEDYFNSNDIMATRANIACTFSQGTPRELFRLMGQQPPETISERGYKTEVPSWILCTLNNREYSPQLPRAFTENTRNSLMASPVGKNLENLSLHFYLLGIRLALLLKEKSGQQIAYALIRIFEQRAGWILKLAVDPVFKPLQLDLTEKRIFFKAQKSEIRTIDWFHRNNNKENQTIARKRSHAEIS